MYAEAYMCCSAISKRLDTVKRPELSSKIACCGKTFKNRMRFGREILKKCETY